MSNARLFCIGLLAGTALVLWALPDPKTDIKIITGALAVIVVGGVCGAIAVALHGDRK